MRRLVVLMAVVLAGAGWGHARLKAPVPRNNSDALKDPNGPCGAVARTGSNTVYQVGNMVKVDFEETINHPGCFIISFSEQNDQNFTTLTTVKHNGQGALPRQYSAQAKLPDGVTCQNCTMQLIQVMLSSYDGGACLRNLPGASNYYSCADIRVQMPDGGMMPDAGTGGGAGGGGGSSASGGGGASSSGGGVAGAGGGAASSGGGAASGSGGGAGSSGGGEQSGSSGGGAPSSSGGGQASSSGGGAPSSSGGGNPMSPPDSQGGVVDGNPSVGCSAVPVAPLATLLLATALLLRRRHAALRAEVRSRTDGCRREPEPLVRRPLSSPGARWWRGWTAVVLLSGCAPLEPAAVRDAGADAGVDAGQPRVDAGHQASPALRACAAFQVSPAPKSIVELTRRLSELPAPVTPACVVAATARPVAVLATSSSESAQPAAGKKSPRVFLLTTSLSVSVALDGAGKDLLELGEWVSPTRSLKGELALPLAAPTDELGALRRVEYPGVGTSCGLCHRDESPHAGLDGGYDSLAFRPNPGLDVPLAALEAEHQSCIAADDASARCELLHALFDLGQVRQGAFSKDVPLFIQ